jgi:hypothetical protein
MSEAQQQQSQYGSKAQFDKLVAYVQELVKHHNALEERVIGLESHEKTRQRIENGQQELKAKKLDAKAAKFQGRGAALEAESMTEKMDIWKPRLPSDFGWHDIEISDNKTQNLVSWNERNGRDEDRGPAAEG